MSGVATFIGRRAALQSGAAAALWLGLALAPAGTALAQQGFDSPPKPGPARALQLPQLSQSRLPNGVGLAVLERHAQPLVTVLLLLPAGSVYDPPGKAGLAELSFTLLGKGVQRGTEALDAGELAAAVEALGAQLDIATGPLAGHLALTVASNRLDESLALLAEMLRSPSLSGEELERARAQAQDGLKLALADPAQLAGLLARRIHWGDSPRGHLPGAASLGRIRLEDVRGFLRQHVRPERLSVVLSGDVTPAAARALAERHFGSWRSNRMALPPLPDTQARPLPVQTLLLDLPGAGQAAVQVLAPAPGFGATAEQRAARLPQQRAALLAHTVLGVGYSSRLNQEVRIRRGLSYGAFSTLESLPDGGLLSAGAQTQHESAAEVAALMAQQIRLLAEQEVAAPELAARRAVLLGEFGRQLETTAGLAALAVEQLMRGQELAALRQLPAELAAVEAPQLGLLAAEFWQSAPLRSVIVADLKAAGVSLRQRFPQALVIKAEELDLSSPTLKRGGRK